MSGIVIPNTALCAIVRDEKMNPAGGIADFVDSTMPFLESGVIVDTGSQDGTLEILNQLALKYPHLRIYSRRFDGFASSRNYALNQVKAGYVLVLDADERLTEDDFEKLKLCIEENPSKGYSLKFLQVYPDGRIEEYSNTVEPRLFKFSERIIYKSDPTFREYTSMVSRPWNHKSDYEINGIAIKHFCPSEKGMKAKKEFYWGLVLAASGKLPAPSEIDGFSEMRAFNKMRNRLNEINSMFFG